MFNMYVYIERKISFGGYKLFWDTLYKSKVTPGKEETEAAMKKKQVEWRRRVEAILDYYQK